eukprot:TRINITY_DN7220_c0_g1_i1.p1 TRINITY_DN7220_c0_g1~~TRINITY_DN7220_c0_g1_i1.p1  ORF type:complete len:119 (-),score=2.96 TRINITY_DN7220_c0_g1_i1:52-408(-)
MLLPRFGNFKEENISVVLTLATSILLGPFPLMANVSFRITKGLSLPSAKFIGHCFLGTLIHCLIIAFFTTIGYFLGAFVTLSWMLMVLTFECVLGIIVGCCINKEAFPHLTAKRKREQ